MNYIKTNHGGIKFKNTRKMVLNSMSTENWQFWLLNLITDRYQERMDSTRVYPKKNPHQSRFLWLFMVS